MKARDIMDKALAEITAFAIFEFTNIVDHLTSKGEIDPDTNTYDAYFKDFGITKTLMADFFVSDTYQTSYWTERREVVGLRFDREDKTIYVIPCGIDLDWQDPPKLKSLTPDDLTEAVNYLEQMWNNLIK